MSMYVNLNLQHLHTFMIHVLSHVRRVLVVVWMHRCSTMCQAFSGSCRKVSQWRQQRW